MSYDPRLAAGLQGGVRTDIQNNVVAADTVALAAAQAQAEGAERRRRVAAALTPGHGVPLALPQPTGGPGIGLNDVPGLGVAGEGYDVRAPDAPAQVAADHGVLVFARRPQYAAADVGGMGYLDGIAQPGLPSPSISAVDVVSAPGKPSMWSRLWDRVRGRG